MERCKVNGNFALGYTGSLLGMQKRQRGHSAEQHLGGDATAIQAGSAKVRFFDQGNALACLGKNARCRGSAGAAAQNNGIKRLHDAPYLTMSALNRCWREAERYMSRFCSGRGSSPRMSHTISAVTGVML